MATLRAAGAVAAYVAGVFQAFAACLQFFGAAREGRELSQLRVALSTRLDGLIMIARDDFSRAVPLPDGWDPSIAVQVQPGRRRGRRRFGR
ncbi:hypothetical protein ACFV2H_24625 [Streptomyces sp. NPDC059629]|uniref:hypothetical protein n=1 Tax=Streptomyces sp. NPDC059629 TaxID=3346889 RepID=UPI00367A6136